MSWWPWGEKAGEASSSKSSLRDAKNRLRSILMRCGVEEDESQKDASTGDPFQDKVNQFTRSIKTVRDEIVERNQHVRDQIGNPADIAAESQEITRELIHLEKELAGLQKMLAEGAEKLRKKEEKEKDKLEHEKSDLLKSLRRSQTERTTSITNCKVALDAVKDLNMQRGMSEEEVTMQGKGAAPRTFRTTLDKLKQRRRANYAVDDGQSTDLRENDETKEQMKLLAQKQKQQDDSLRQLSQVLGEINNNAKIIHAELVKQTAMIDSTTGVVDDMTSRLQKLNKGIKKLLEETSGVQISMYVIACLLVLAVIGFFAVEFT